MPLDVGETFTRKRKNSPYSWLLQRLGFLIIVSCILYSIFPMNENENERSIPTEQGPSNSDSDSDLTLDDYFDNVVKPMGINSMSKAPPDGSAEIRDSDLVTSNLNSDSDSNTECQYRGLTHKNVFSGNLRVPQDDSNLLGFVRKCVFTRPSTLPYNLVDPTGDPSAEQGVRKYVSKLLGNKRNGVYIDCGANDGEDISNTLVLERDFGWSGLLIEADPKNAKKLLEKHRKAWVANVCAGIHPYPYEMEMYRHVNWTLTSRLAEGIFERGGPDWTKFKVKCLPLYTMMSALNLKDLDYMSMDIEGVELRVLNTLPFDKINVKVFSIETIPKTWNYVRAFMYSKGYAFVKTFRGPLVEDDVFIRVSLLNHAQQEVFAKAKIII